MTSEASTSPQVHRNKTRQSAILLPPLGFYYAAAPSPSPPPSPAAPPPARQTTTEARASGHDRQEAQVLQEAAQGQPLGTDADAVAYAGKSRRSGAAKRHQAEEKEFVPSSVSAKILRKALKQQQEEILHVLFSLRMAQIINLCNYMG